MKKIVFPHSFVNISIWHFVNTIAFFYSFSILSLVRTAILPSLFPFSMRLIHLPLSLIFLSKFIHINTISVSMIIYPLPLISIAIFIRKKTLSPSTIISPLPFILRSISPSLSTFSISNIFLNVPVIYRSISEFYNLNFRSWRRL